MDALGITLVVIVMLAGLVGTLVPVIPGLPLIWAAALVYGLGAGFTTIGWIAFATITALLVVGTVLKFVVPQRRARASGAPLRSLLAGAALGVVGFFVIPVVGLPLGALAGIFVAEGLRTGDWGVARAATKETIIGFGVGALIELGAGLAMVLVWFIWAVIDR